MTSISRNGRTSISRNPNIPFLDIMVMKKKSGILGTEIYRKETHTNRYLNYESCHHSNKNNKKKVLLLVY